MPKVVVVDDEYSIAHVVKDMLEDEGYTVYIATNPEDGLKLIEQTMPDLVVCDRLMPVMNGNELCRMLYTDERLRSIPVVMMSAVHNRAMLPVPNCTQFLSKPFHFLQLISTVEDSLLIGVPTA